MNEGTKAMKKKNDRSGGTQVQCVYVEDRIGNKVNDVEIHDPTLKQVVQAVRRLNGKNTTMVTMELEGKRLCIAGGTKGRYVAELTYGIDDAFYTLLHSREPVKPGGSEVELVTGQQAVTAPGREVLDLRTVMKAVEHFANHGTMCSTLIWRKHK